MEVCFNCGQVGCDPLFWLYLYGLSLLPLVFFSSQSSKERLNRIQVEENGAKDVFQWKETDIYGIESGPGIEMDRTRLKPNSRGRGTRCPMLPDEGGRCCCSGFQFMTFERKTGVY